MAVLYNLFRHHIKAKTSEMNSYDLVQKKDGAVIPESSFWTIVFAGNVFRLDTGLVVSIHGNSQTRFDAGQP